MTFAWKGHQDDDFCMKESPKCWLLHEKVGKYEELINKRAQLFKQRNIDYKKLEEKDFKNLLLEHYTFIKRPILIYDEKIFVGNSPKTILKAIKFLNEQ